MLCLVRTFPVSSLAGGKAAGTEDGLFDGHFAGSVLARRSRSSGQTSRKFLLRCAVGQLSRLVLMTYSVSATVSAMPTAAREITMTVRFFRTNARNPEAGWTG